MPHRKLYRHQPPRISADILRADKSDMRGAMNPLTGIWGTCVTAPSYLASAPNGAGDVGSRATVHCSLLSVHWTFTFSAKEKDSETGLSYFGSRYYSSDLSVWLSVDPMAGKYPSLSPYTYCADNPIMLFDPNGQKSWPIASKHQNGDRCIISGVRRNSNGAKHGGVDIVHRSPKGNLRGGTITATHNGKVTASGYSKTAGNWIQITNGDIRTSYMHMEEAPKQKVGEWVSENDVVGQVGSTGHSYGPHIHYQIELYNQETGSWEKVNPVMEGYEKVTYDMDVHLMDPQIYINNRDKLDGFLNKHPIRLDEIIIQDNNKSNDFKNEIDSL